MLSVQMGIPVWLIIVILVWSAIWKLLALWKAARKNHIVWFIVFAFVNLVGILEILYIYVFSEMNVKKKRKEFGKKVRKRK